MAVEPAFLSLKRPSGTAQVSGTMDPPKEGTKLLSKFAVPESNLPKSPSPGTSIVTCSVKSELLPPCRN
jgi:hypothetical protein